MISTGTPAGGRFCAQAPCWLKPGDEMVGAGEGLRELVNPVSGGRAEGRRNRLFRFPVAVSRSQGRRSGRRWGWPTLLWSPLDALQ